MRATRSWATAAAVAAAAAPVAAGGGITRTFAMRVSATDFSTKQVRRVDGLGGSILHCRPRVV
jgi:hypothetical protein